MFGRRRKRFEEMGAEEILRVIAQPSEFQRLSPPELNAAIFFGLGYLGRTDDQGFLAPMMRCYRHYVETVPPAIRMDRLDSILPFLVEREFSALALHPILYGETEPALIARATLEYAMVARATPDNPYRSVDELVQAIRGGSMRGVPGYFAGLLLLGDRAVNERLKPVRDLLDVEGLTLVLRMRIGYLCAAYIEFWIEWMEEAASGADARSQSIVGGILGALEDWPFLVEDPNVVDIRRRLDPPTPDEGIELLSIRSFREYFAEIRPRLEAIARRETEPKMMPGFIASWERAAVTEFPAQN
jgi:hypothetical protein